ncbi:hypothetical protein KL86DYS1_11816 [uncultured Dysgonomonas sp.]|uniref:Uncharacterized protein n=1 Tax=uncultured Dysgonomonas sp. TaxID=206096 RepID=A0A212JCA9_9BACT|nr:hypothetical protein KL86DYS1_11816 [uncultured Dysgonomonas sp.]
MSCLLVSHITFNLFLNTYYFEKVTKVTLVSVNSKQLSVIS